MKDKEEPKLAPGQYCTEHPPGRHWTPKDVVKLIILALELGNPLIALGVAQTLLTQLEEAEEKSNLKEQE